MARLGHSLADHLYRSEPGIVAQSLGLILAGALILAWAGLRILDKIGV